MGEGHKRSAGGILGVLKTEGCEGRICRSGVRGEGFARIFKKEELFSCFCIPDSRGFMEVCTIPDHIYVWSHLDVRGRGN
jgi:hypothetical protein